MPRTVGYTPSSASPRTVPVTVLVVLVLLVGVGVGGWFVGRGSAPDGKTSNASPPHQAGPAPVASGTSGFPRTPEGAGDAFSSYVRRTFELTTAPVEQGDAFLRQIAAPGAEQEVAAKMNTRGLQNGSPNAINNFIPVRVITVPDPDGTVRALVWGNSILAVKSDGVTAQTPPATSWITVTARLSWGTDGTWKLSQVEDAKGPTPISMDEPDDVSKFGKVLAETGRTPGGR